jgi:hypothetical protein
MLNIIIQNQRNIYVLSFETMAIITSCSFFTYMNVKKFKQNFYFIKILSLGFNLGCLKMNTC